MNVEVTIYGEQARLTFVGVLDDYSWQRRFLKLRESVKEGDRARTTMIQWGKRDTCIVKEVP